MKTYLLLCTSFFLLFFNVSPVSAGFFDSFINNGAPEIRYCSGDDAEDCGLQEGIDIVKDGLNGVEIERSASEYIQDIVLYLLTFISLIAVIYIIYAGFQILVGNGDEEKLKHSKQTILYVVIGIFLIWLAWPITRFIFQVLNG